MLYNAFRGNNVRLDFYNMKIILANAISQMVVMLAILGKMNIVQFLLHSITYNIAWTFNYFLCIKLQNISPDERVFDDYQISMVYLFGACYGLVMSMVNPKPPLVEQFSSN